MALLLALALAVPSTLLAQSPELLGRLQAKLDSLVAPGAVPGITLGVAMPDGTSFGLATGWADTSRHVAMTPDARMLQGSVGKTYFGAVALQLVAEGRLELDRRVADYLGDRAWYDRVPNAREVTVRQIMSHTSGIVRYEFNPRFLEDLTADPMRTFTPEQRLEYLFDTEPPFAPGEGWEYSDTNFILVAMLIEQVTGNEAYDEIRQRVLVPGGFHNTVPSDRPEVPGLVQGYAGQGNPFGGFDAMVQDGRLAINPQFEWGGGGFASTAQDLARWTWAIQEGRVFNPSLLADYRQGTPAPLGPDASYGLGVIMMELPAGTAWGHSGFMPGYRTEAYYFPDGRFALALQVNTSAQGAFPPSPLRMLADLAATVREGLPPTP
jgi:D-alanyl-D-alanine carboxypeptidase